MNSKKNLPGSELVQDRDGRTFYFPAWIKTESFFEKLCRPCRPVRVGDSAVVAYIIWKKQKKSFEIIKQFHG